MMAAEGHSDQLPSDTEVRMKQRSGTELLCAEQMAPTDIQGSRPRGRCRPHWMWLWLYVLGLVPVFLAVDVALGAGRLLAFLAVAGALGPGSLQASWAGAVASGHVASAGLWSSGCALKPLDWFQPFKLRL